MTNISASLALENVDNAAVSRKKTGSSGVAAGKAVHGRER